MIDKFVNGNYWNAEKLYFYTVMYILDFRMLVYQHVKLAAEKR